MVRRRYKRKIRKNYLNPFNNIFSLLLQKEVIEDDFFKENSLCLLGMQKPLQYYVYTQFPKNPLDQTICLNIDKSQNLNLGVIAGSGVGKTKILKNIISSLHKEGYKIIIFSPKEDEWESAKHKGKAINIHYKNENEKLPIVSYCPSYIKNYLETQEFSTAKYKFYSHSISTYNTSEAMKSLGFTDNIASFCVAQVIQNKDITLDELKFAIINSDISPNSKNPALTRISNLINSKYFNKRLKPLDIEGEWNKGNIIAINYFSRDGSVLSSDVSKIVTQIRELAQKNVRKNNKQKIMILFDDGNYYLESKIYNECSIKSVLNCQINYRALGINNITAYQFPESVDSKIVKGSTKKLISYIEQPSSLNGIIPSDALYCLQASEEDGGIKVDMKNYIVEWIYREEGREWYRFFPEDCKIGHKF